MRKYDIFGKKISQVKFLYSLIIVFLLVIAGYFGVIQIQENRLYELEQQERKIQRQIDELLSIDQPVAYETIDELIPYLPQTFDQYVVNNELNYVLNSSSFHEIINYNVSYSDKANTPFQQSLPETVKFVRISINLTVSEPEKLLDYLDYLYGLDRLYYVQQFNVSYSNDGAIAQMIIFTFYNSIN